MYYVSKRIEIAGAHHLKLDYESKCSNLHGHNWIITVYCKSEELNNNGMVVDFAHIKKHLTETFDHQYINAVEPFDKLNPTAENMARYCVETIPCCYKATVQESEGNIATYEKDEAVVHMTKMSREEFMQMLAEVAEEEDDKHESGGNIS